MSNGHGIGKIGYPSRSSVGRYIGPRGARRPERMKRVVEGLQDEAAEKREKQGLGAASER